MKFYYVDEGYIEYLRKFEDNVTYKKERPYIGVILEYNNQLYFSPLTSPKEYLEKNKKYKRIHYPIHNGDLGHIKLGNSIPISKQYVTKINIKEIQNMEYKNLLINQYNFIAKNESNIKNKFSKLFDSIYGKNHFLKSICCNFEVLEVAAQAYSKYKKIESILVKQYDVKLQDIKLNICDNDVIVNFDDNFIPISGEDAKVLVRHLIIPFTNQEEYKAFKLKENIMK